MWQRSTSVRLTWMVVLASSFAGIVALPTWAQESESVGESERRSVGESNLPIHPSTHSPATTVTDWIAQLETSLVQITGVQVEETATGLQIVLETVDGDLAVSETQSIGNALIVDIANATLAEEFSQAEPIEGIALVNVTALPGDRVRVAITGTDAPPIAEVTSDAQGLVLAVTTGGAETVAEDDAIQIVATGEQADDYYVPDASVGTRTDTPLRDIPQAIQVIPEAALRDQQATRLGDALRNATGVNSTRGSGDRADSFVIRGFEIFSGNVLSNGLPDRTLTETRDLYNFERVEVLRGPASVLYGLGNPGGTVNIVTRQPLAIPFYEVEGTIGSNELYRGAVDLSGPLDESGALLYRLNVAYQDTDSYIDFIGSRSFFIAPVVRLAIGDNTTLTLEGEHSRRTIDSRSVVVLPAVGTVLPGPDGRRIPRSRTVYEPDGNTEIETTRIGYRLEHQFSENWSLRNDFRVAFERNRDNDQSFFLGLDADGRTANRSTYSSDSDSNIYNLTTDVVGRFSTGSLEHQLLFGVNLSRLDNFNNFGIDLAELAPLDIYDPVYRQPPIGRIDTVYEDGSRLTDSLGIYLQDQIAIADNLKLLLGGRFDLFEQTNRDFLSDTRESQSGDAFTPRVGIVYQPIPPISLYASYSRSFNPTEGRAADGGVFEPERGTQYEIGVKAEVNDRLAATLALYDLTRSNLLTVDPDDSRFSIQTGEQRSQGVEVDLSGEILPGWNIIVGYAYTDARITDDNTFETGNRLTNAPEHNINLWTTYEIQSGDLRGLGFGLGLFYIGDRAGDLDNSFDVPGYLRADAALFYRRDRLRVALNVKNLFDENYFVSVSGRDFVLRGDPFTVSGTVAWEF
uniref:TonB-dependent siderophore receptor n=1 Tax=Oculatella sp. LEGE 06141 TaxID=1828648 RepID=UPI0030DBA65A